MKKQVVALVVVLIPLVIALGMATFFGERRETATVYRGMTPRQWERTFYVPLWKLYLSRVGWKIADTSPGELDDPEAIPVLIELVRSQEANVRGYATHVLGRLGAAAKPAVPALLVALSDSAPHVRENAADGLWRIDPDTARYSGLPEPSWWPYRFRRHSSLGK